MFKIFKLGRLVDAYHDWLKKYNNHLEFIEETILQKDNRDKIEEKIVSIIISAVFVSICVSVLTFFGFHSLSGFVGSVILFVIGWFLSKGFNKKIFGSERKLENLSDEEKQIIDSSNDLKKYFKPITLRVRLKKEKVYFSNYVEIKKKIEDLHSKMSMYSGSKLAYKYRYRYGKDIKKQILLQHDFENIYTGKNKRKKY